MRQPVDHVLRPSLPWRTEAAITECGLDASKVSALSRDAYIQRLKEMGQQRAALHTCMTCGDTARRWKTWDADPREALQREINWESGWHRGDDRGCLLLDELRAIEALIKANPESFAALVAGSTRRREWLKMKATREQQEKQ